MPDRHALLGPSSAHRWLVCTRSARLEEGMEETSSTYTREGTLAHKLAELTLRAFYEDADGAAEEINRVKLDPLYTQAMLEHVTGYVDYIGERMNEAHSRCGDPEIFIEAEVDLSEYVPESFGTADCVIIADETMDVIDFKYGAGVPVSAKDNPQMKLYGLGCLLAYGWLYGVKTVRMTIYQPRIDNISTDTISAADLMAWARDELKPLAQQAWDGTGDFNPQPDACRWCKVGATCRARANYQLEVTRKSFEDPPQLTLEEVAHVLSRIPGWDDWVKAVSDYALDQAVNHGVAYPGFKLVEGTSKRKYTDEQALAALLRQNGYKPGDLFKPKALIGITDMEKLVGKKHLSEICATYSPACPPLIVKPEGKPTLVPESDKRPALDSTAKVAEAFADE